MHSSILYLVAFVALLCGPVVAIETSYASASGSFSDTSVRWVVPAIPTTVSIPATTRFEFRLVSKLLFFGDITAFLTYQNFGYTFGYTYGSSGFVGSIVRPGDQLYAHAWLVDTLVWRMQGFRNGTLLWTRDATLSATPNVAGTIQAVMMLNDIGQCTDLPPVNSFMVQIPGLTSLSWTNINGISVCSGGMNSFSNGGFSSVEFTWNSGYGNPYDFPGVVYMDMAGGDTSFALASSGLDCARQCDGIADCKGWTYVYPGADCPNNFNCWLKSTLNNPTAFSCGNSNIKVGDMGVDRPGGDMAGMPTNLGPQATASMCANLCDNNVNCVQWAFAAYSPQGSCWLKSFAVPATPNANVISGHRGISQGFTYYIMNEWSDNTPTQTCLDSNVGGVPQYSSTYPRAFMWALQGVTGNHQWTFINAGEGFLIKSLYNNLCYDGDNSVPQFLAGYTVPFMNTCNVGSWNQRWLLKPYTANGRHQYHIINKQNGLCLDSNGGHGYSFSSVAINPFLWQCSDNPNHIWTITIAPYYTLN